jgi:hypothetical protein
VIGADGGEYVVDAHCVDEVPNNPAGVSQAHTVVEAPLVGTMYSL